jgi:hypothetical protein
MTGTKEHTYITRAFKNCFPSENKFLDLQLIYELLSLVRRIEPRNRS